MLSPRARANLRHSRRGGLLLDVVLAFGVILIGAFLLGHLGLSFHELLHGAEHFFAA
jgi:hypothetical protein